MSKRIRSASYPSRTEPPPAANPAQPGIARPINYALLTLSEQGSIVAANEQAAALLGRPPEEMVGLQFGDLASGEQTDELELLAWRRGRLEPLAVEVERVPSEWGDSYVALALRPLPERPAPSLALSEALGLAIADANPFLPRRSFELRLSRCPDVRVAAGLRRVIGGWISFLAEAAGDARADLQVAVTEDEDSDSVRLWLRLARRREARRKPGRSGDFVSGAALEEQLRQVADDTGVSVRNQGGSVVVCLRLPLAAVPAASIPAPR